MPRAGNLDEIRRLRKGRGKPMGLAAGDESIVAAVNDEHWTVHPRGDLEQSRPGQGDARQLAGAPGDQPGQQARTGKPAIAEPARHGQFEVNHGRSKTRAWIRESSAAARTAIAAPIDRPHSTGRRGRARLGPAARVSSQTRTSPASRPPNEAKVPLLRP